MRQFKNNYTQEKQLRKLEERSGGEDERAA
jgi:hypothetical protein